MYHSKSPVNKSETCKETENATCLTHSFKKKEKNKKRQLQDVSDDLADLEAGL